MKHKNIQLVVSISIDDLRRIVTAFPNGQISLTELDESAPKKTQTKQTKTKKHSTSRKAVHRVGGKPGHQHVKDWLRVHRAGRRFEIVNYLKSLGYSHFSSGQIVDHVCKKMSQAGEIIRARGHVSTTPNFQ